MDLFNKIRWEKTKYFILFSLTLVFLVLIVSYYKNEEIPISKKEIIAYRGPDVKLIKDFFFSKINSPFLYNNYEVKKGDTIQKILKNYKIKDKEIHNIIKQYKKYVNSKQLFAGNKIEITIKKNPTKKENSIIRISIPVTKSTTVEIKKDEDGQIISEKIITKLYKRKILAENIIKKSLYASAVNAKVNPETIIECARIFGFEIDFQRDIRKNDYFKIVYDKYFDENGVFVKSVSILYAHMSVNG